MPKVKQESTLGVNEHMKSVWSLLKRADQGQLALDMEKGLADMLKALDLNGGKATMTVTVAATMQNGQIVFRPTLKMALPEAERTPTFEFVGDNGELSGGRDPRQPEMGVLKEADFRNGVPAVAVDA